MRKYKINSLQVFLIHTEDIELIGYDKNFFVDNLLTKYYSHRFVEMNLKQIPQKLKFKCSKTLKDVLR